jgi:dTDP-4-dehydrorhamnose 3,5-epimerase
VPPGFAHGFQVLSEVADVHYKCTDYYDPGGESGLLWNDSAVGIRWPLGDGVLSDKDQALPTLEELIRMRGP